MNDAKYLEVLASIHYINETTFSGNGSYDELKKALLNAKPSLKTVEGIDDTISEAYKKLQEFNNIYAS
jgi:riboflavin synthase